MALHLLYMTWQADRPPATCILLAASRIVETSTAGTFGIGVGIGSATGDAPAHMAIARIAGKVKLKSCIFTVRRTNLGNVCADVSDYGMAQL